MHTVITDANVLINLAIADGLGLLSAIVGMEFVVPEEVLGEITRPSHREKVDAAIANGALTVVRLDALESLGIFATLRAVMGVGEASCLALAEHNGWMIASDEKKVFKREAVRRLGAGKIVTTADIYINAIKDGAISVADADAAKTVLAANRFAMPFASFAELI